MSGAPARTPGEVMTSPRETRAPPAKNPRPPGGGSGGPAASERGAGGPHGGATRFALRVKASMRSARVPAEALAQLGELGDALRGRGRAAERQEDLEGGGAGHVVELDAQGRHAVEVAGLFDRERGPELPPAD